MASEKITAIIEELKVLTVLELSELVHAVEEEFGVSAAAAVAVAAPAAGGAAAAEEKTEFDVVLANAEITGGSIMAIKYADMTREQQQKAERWADKFGVPVEACTMNNLGDIVTNKKKMLKYMSSEDYDILSRGSKNGYVDKRSELTDEVRELYRAEMAQLKADSLPKVRLK